MTKISNTQIRSLIQDLRDYASSYITKEYYQTAIVNEGIQIIICRDIKMLCFHIQVVLLMIDVPFYKETYSMS